MRSQSESWWGGGSNPTSGWLITVHEALISPSQSLVRYQSLSPQPSSIQLPCNETLIKAKNIQHAPRVFNVFFNLDKESNRLTAVQQPMVVPDQSQECQSRRKTGNRGGRVIDVRATIMMGRMTIWPLTTTARSLMVCMPRTAACGRFYFITSG
jgi:hypothetical protein